MNQKTQTLQPVIVLVGPTASGKTSVAIALAQMFDAEIISADSRQMYRHMTIGTAKPSADELAQVPHYFIDTLDPGDEYSAGQYSRDARALIAQMRQAGKNIIVVGGSGMYIDALLNGFFEPIVQDKELQNALKKRATEEGCEALYAELEKVDPERAAELAPLDAHRIVRALEIFYTTRQKPSELLKRPRIPADFPFVQFALEWDRTKLYRRIEMRVDQMLEHGLLAEVKKLLDSGIPPQTNALLTVGYREVIQFFAGDYTYEEMVDKIKQHTRNYAKRQMTWFRRDDRIQWIACSETTSAEEIATAMREKFTYQ